MNNLIVIGCLVLAISCSSDKKSSQGAPAAGVEGATPFPESGGGSPANSTPTILYASQIAPFADQILRTDCAKSENGFFAFDKLIISGSGTFIQETFYFGSNNCLEDKLYVQRISGTGFVKMHQAKSSLVMNIERTSIVPINEKGLQLLSGKDRFCKSNDWKMDQEQECFFRYSIENRFIVDGNRVVFQSDDNVNIAFLINPESADLTTR